MLRPFVIDMPLLGANVRRGENSINTSDTDAAAWKEWNDAVERCGENWQDGTIEIVRKP